MSYLFPDVEERRYTAGPLLTENEVPALFPLARWNFQRQQYITYWRYFTGEIWGEKTGRKDKNGNEVLRYPLGINHIKTACLKQNYMLWGEATDDPGPLVPMICTPKPAEDETPTNEDKKLARRTENFVNSVWEENDGRVLQYEGGLISQPLGGVYYRLDYVEDEPDLYSQIKIELVLPDFVLPVWNTTNNKLLEIWVVYRIPAREAMHRFGINIGQETPMPVYMEHWTADEITITINQRPIEHNGILYDKVENPYGFIPFEYVPRERAGNFYGLSAIDDLAALSREINARLADIGDATRDNVYRTVWVKNVTGSIKTMDMPDDRDAINLGTTNIASQGEPEIGVIDPPKLDKELVDFPNALLEQFRRDSFVPPVADGQDEGSQRSALTLAFRMWPLTANVRAQRTRWTIALVRMAKMIIRMAAYHNLGGFEDDSVLKQVRFSCDWPDMVPRDREQAVNETVLAIQTNMLAPIDGNKRLRLSVDPEEAQQRVREHLGFMADMVVQQEAAKMKLQTPAASSGAEAEQS